ncbi:MAG: phage tail protein [Neomegalonema sp.]|nr:phage tail protein [Neomegalonema sp.]
MATLVLTGAAAAFAGSATGAATAFTIAGSAVTWGAIATSVATAAGAYIDSQLFGPQMPDTSGPRVTDLNVAGGAEGAPIPRVYGTMRIPALNIWATRLREVQDEESVGGKGGGTATTYEYFASFAVCLGEGEIDHVGRVWADNQQIDIAEFTTRTYMGTQEQQPDALIEAVEGVAPAYRGLAYMVFEDAPLQSFGSRVPTLAVEVTRGFETADASGLRALVLKICADYGVTVDASGVDEIDVTGYYIDRAMSCRAALQPLLAAFRLDIAEIDGGLAIWSRNEAISSAWAEGDLVAQSNNAPVEWTRAAVRELPRKAVMTYRDQDRDYQAGAVSAQRTIGNGLGEITVDVPVAMTETAARKIADAALAEAWDSQRSAKFTLPPSAIGVAPGDVIELTEGERIYSLRCSRVGWSWTASVEAAVVGDRVAPRRIYHQRPGLDSTPPAYVPLDVVVMDMALASDDQPLPFAPRVAVDASVWGKGAIYGSPTGDAYTLLGQIERRSAIGVTTAHVAKGVTGCWDRGSELIVRMQRGQLSSATEQEVYAGRNRLAVQGPIGGWEIVGYRDAELIDVRTYRLTHLLRGLRGTEAHRGTGIGSRVVRLDGAVQTLPLPSERAKLENILRIGPQPLPFDDPRYIQTTGAFKGIGQRPYAPCHLRARLMASGDLALGWVRRTRIGGDDWESADVPLSEASERYRVRIRVGGIVVRDIEADSQGVVYSEADALADHGGAMPSAVDMSVQQYSDDFGWGASRRESVRVTTGGAYADSYEQVLDPLPVVPYTHFLRNTGYVYIYWTPIEDVTVRAEAANGAVAERWGSSGGLRLEGLSAGEHAVTLTAYDDVQISAPVVITVTAR